MTPTYKIEKLAAEAGVSLPSVGRVLLPARWYARCGLALPIAQLLYKMKLYDMPWMASSARNRIVIWGATSDW